MKPQDLIESMDPFFPADFFRLELEIRERETELPDLSGMLAEESFASVSLSWSPEGIQCTFEVKEPLTGSFFPDYDKGDAIEIFIDTRDNKSASFASRFCHRFVILGEEVSGIKAQEITRFRSEDSHPLCDPEDIDVEIKKKRSGYDAIITLPKVVLYGYDPLQFAGIGFAYRIHRQKNTPQHFPFSTKHFEPLQHPALWASLLLV